MFNIKDFISLINSNKDVLIEKSEIQEFQKTKTTPSIFTEFFNSIGNSMTVDNFEKEILNIIETEEKNNGKTIVWNVQNNQSITQIAQMILKQQKPNYNQKDIDKICSDLIQLNSTKLDGSKKGFLVNSEIILPYAIDITNEKKSQNPHFDYVKSTVSKRVKDVAEQYDISDKNIDTEVFKAAQYIASQFNKEYGTLNSSSIQYFYEPHYTTYEKDDERIGNMREEYYSVNSEIERLDKESELVRKNKLANCGECADLGLKIGFDKYKDKFKLSTIYYEGNTHVGLQITDIDTKEEYIIDTWVNPQKGCVFKKEDWVSMCKKVFEKDGSRLEEFDSTFKKLKDYNDFTNELKRYEIKLPKEATISIEAFCSYIQQQLKSGKKFNNDVLELYYMYGQKYITYDNGRDAFLESKYNYAEQKYTKFWDKFKTQQYPDNSVTLNQYLNNVKDEDSFIQAMQNNYKEIVETIDKSCYGWGNGKNKKNLMMPLVNKIIEVAQKKNLSKETIQNFKKTCLKELDAKIYTDEKAISHAFYVILDELKWTVI